MNLDLNILKAISTNKNLAQDFLYECNASYLEAEYFAFAQTLLKYISSNKDVPTLRVLKEKHAKQPKLVETIENTWKKLESINYNEKDFKHDLENLKTRFATNKISLLREELNNTDNVLSLIPKLKSTVNDVNSLSRKKAFEKKSLKDVIPSFTEEYNAKLEARKNGVELSDCVKTGYSAFDNYTGGLQDGEFLLICGESNSGKSMLLMNMSIQMWMQNNTIDSTTFTNGHNILYFSLEMPLKPCFNRVLARLAGVETNKLKNALLNKEEQARVKKALNFIKNYPFQFEIVDIPRGTTIEVIESIFEETKASFIPKVVSIDYMGIMDYEGGAHLDDWLKLGHISAGIHEFGRVHKVIVLSAVQLNRMKPTKETEEKIGMHRIGRSALIVTNANIAVQIHTRQNEIQYPDMEYYIIKNREGQLGRGMLMKQLSCGSLFDSPLEIEESFIDANDLSSYMEDLQGF
jgi:replicative DNA helicase